MESEMSNITEFVCIVCPNGCPLRVESHPAEDGSGMSYTVSGNRCQRGIDFAKTEMTAPKRTICSTVQTAFADVPVLPVRVSAEIPKERIFDVIAEIAGVCVKTTVGRGDIVLQNVCGLGVDVIATSNILLWSTKEREV